MCIQARVEVMIRDKSIMLLNFQLFFPAILFKSPVIPKIIPVIDDKNDYIFRI